MENISNIIRETDSRILIQDLEIIRCEESFAVFLTLILPFYLNDAELEEMHYRLLENIRSLDEKYECAIALKTALAA